MPKKDLTGQHFGKLTVLRDSGQRASNGAILWECQCSCGNITNVTGSNLTRKNIKQRVISCGKCYKGEDLVGKKFNKLTVLRMMNYKTGSSQVWECQCDCGNITYVNSRNLRSGEVKSCGCLLSGGRREFQSPINIVGETYGLLTVLSYVGHSKWNCKCQCGNNITVTTSNLKSGNTQSCGCSKHLQVGEIYNNWKILEITKDYRNNYILYKCECQRCKNITLKTSSEIKAQKSNFCSKCRIIDLTGQKFGKLTVLELDTEQTTSKKTYWKCQCDCGNQTSVEGSNLKSGNTKSCGCLLKEYQSYGEQKIEAILQQYNIAYETQKKFPSCQFPDTHQLAKFDFYLLDSNILIEYDGEQHFYDIDYFSDSLKDIQKRDRFKNQWCQINNIPLIRIPYTHLSNICLEDLQLDTTRFLCKCEEV